MLVIENFLFNCIFPLEWVDAVWELDFTETEPLDPIIEAEILDTGLNAFTKLYESIFPFATEEHGSTEVKKKKKKIKN